MISGTEQERKEPFRDLHLNAAVAVQESTIQKAADFVCSLLPMHINL